mmetsp:Transcript_88436/g.156840  ORF Transcript_88436/g.156840 Transcript_88436/m.156840 type:complete len:614 (+) Transcript_88436:31-1872(+)|eukprot:CAMPEP_0197638414 /NCGR_PEP_ID=MMETSP1338-20131121/13352_1 /TAXON_ID=43686 ORGANISM="Pelagodinium beii, Strain RCC1491" /NCGR_SAMPLE_ID=MMETSP1338 /ASSEMBLY_ACC=CAM_ASM_000754 /LENGTH=613 /DNA_ID=CAMNT_0043210989 /DNA_START=26 /DNA_END=1867 /DNA_ORIENTATION=-
MDDGTPVENYEAQDEKQKTMKNEETVRKGPSVAAAGSSRQSQMMKEVAAYNQKDKGNLFSSMQVAPKNKIQDMKMPEPAGMETTEDGKNTAELNLKYNDGFFGMIAKHKYFEICTICFIILNALAITWDADYSARNETPANLYDGEWYFIFLENLFAVYFTGEILIRFVAYRVKFKCLYDAWFVFDSALVTLMVMETWVMPFVGTSGMGQLSVLRLLRLLRITRMAKLMRTFPELLMIVKGISAATRAVAWTAFLLVMITFTFSIIFTSQFHQGKWTEEEIAALRDDDPRKIYDFFGDMGKSMLNLLIMGTILDDVTAASDIIRANESYGMVGVFIVYIMLNSFMMLNMLVGILVEVVGNTAQAEIERLEQQKAQESIITIFHQLDSDGSGQITKDEFKGMKDDESVMEALQELGIKEKHFDNYTQLLFNPINPDGTIGESQPMSFKTLLDAICRLRPGTCVNLLDFSTLKMTAAKSHENLQARMSRLDKSILSRSDTLRVQPVSGGRKPSNSSSGKASNSGSKGLPPKEKVHQEPRRKVNFQMMAQLEKTPSAEIVSEIQRRLGITSIDEIPVSMMDQELYESVCEANGWTPEIGPSVGSVTPSSEPPLMAW